MKFLRYLFNYWFRQKAEAEEIAKVACGALDKLKDLNPAEARRCANEVLRHLHSGDRHRVSNALSTISQSLQREHLIRTGKQP